MSTPDEAITARNMAVGQAGKGFSQSVTVLTHLTSEGKSIGFPRGKVRKPVSKEPAEIDSPVKMTLV